MFGQMKPQDVNFQQLQRPKLESESSLPQTPSPVRLKPHERDLWGSCASDAKPIGADTPNEKRKGRPPVECDDKTQRGLIRLVLSSPAPVDRIAKAIDDCGGPKRDWTVRVLQKLTGTGPSSGATLSKVRIYNVCTPGASSAGLSRPEWDVASDRCRKCNKLRQEILEKSGKDDTRHDDKTRRRSSALQATDKGEVGRIDRERESSDHAFRLDAFETLVAEPDMIPPDVTRPRQLEQRTLISPGTLAVDEGKRPRGSERSPSGTAAAKNRRQEGKPTRRFPSLSSVAYILDESKIGGYHHLLKCCSLSTGTTASWFSGHCELGTANSEYKTHYHEPKPCRSEERGSDQISSQTASYSMVDLLLSARIDGLTEIEIKKQVEIELKSKDATSLEKFVNGSDSRRVTALHLCVAYGFRDLCRLLMDHGADCRARTGLGTCISHFAKPAEKMASKQTDLYRDIHLCRRFVGRKFRPPSPVRMITTPKRARTTEETHPSQSPSQRRRYDRVPILYPKPSATAPLTLAAPTTTAYDATIDHRGPHFSSHQVTLFDSNIHPQPPQGSAPQYTGSLTISPSGTVIFADVSNGNVLDLASMDGPLYNIPRSTAHEMPMLQDLITCLDEQGPQPISSLAIFPSEDDDFRRYIQRPNAFYHGLDVNDSSIESALVTGHIQPDTSTVFTASGGPSMGRAYPGFEDAQGGHASMQRQLMGYETSHTSGDAPNAQFRDFQQQTSPEWTTNAWQLMPIPATSTTQTMRTDAPGHIDPSRLSRPIAFHGANCPHGNRREDS